MDTELKPEQIAQFKRWMNSPLAYIKDMWGLEPQPLKPQYTHVANVLPAKKFKPEMFKKFQKGKHITWQQWLIIRAVERAIQGRDKKRIAIESGHGTGKSMTLALLVLWYLQTHKDAQVPCTAPTAPLMHDILWKEIEKWKQQMPKEFADSFEMVEGYLRVKESPKTWYARARTASPDKPEALAGIHGEWVMLIIDEASGVHEKIFETAEGSLTDENILVIMASNHTRASGYFHEAFNEDSQRWQQISLDSRQSPVVSEAYVQSIISKYGEDSDQFRVRVAGKAPKADAIDDKGYVPIIKSSDIRKSEVDELVGIKFMGVDPAGAGKDTTDWVVRDHYKAIKVASEKTSDEKGIAQKTITLAELYDIPWHHIVIDNFGVGANVSKHIAMAGYETTPINVGHPSDDKAFLNLRAEGYWKLREWIRAGAELVPDDSWKELTTVKYTRTLQDKIKIMSKADMKKQGINSPNTADALMLTFAGIKHIVEYDEEEGEDDSVEDAPTYSHLGI